MDQTQNPQKSDLFQTALHTPALKGAPAVLTKSGSKLVLIKSYELDPQLRQFLDAGIRHAEVTAFVEGYLLTFKASIVKRGPRLPLHLHPVGEAGKFLTDLYRRRLAASGRRRNSMPLLILSLIPLLEKPNADGRA